MQPNKAYPQKMKTYASYDEWRKDQSSSNQVIIDELHSLIKSVAPHFETTVKWGQGCFVNGKTPRIFLHTEPEYVQLGFYNGSTLTDKHGLLEGNGKYVRHVKVYSVNGIDKEKFSELIKQVTE